MIYRICTQWFDNLPSLASAHFDCFTVVEGKGYWKGVPERSATIEIADSSASAYSRVMTLASLIRSTNAQEAVLVEEIHSSNVLVFSDHNEVI